ncbi:MAG: rnp-1 like RNA-binding protein [Candidatus Parvibacillus calidus]|nr:MAG: rnp-1 like RNA-binding protein [Candidatus Parvibacillus calidus]
MNIFVAKLSGATTADGLKRLFEQFGEVSDVKIIIDRETNMSKGYGFVEMPNVAEGHTAIAELNEAEVDGSIIVVKESQPRTGEKSGFSGGGNRGGNRSFGGGNKFKKPGFGGEDPSTRNLVLAVVVIAITEKADIIAGKTETLINPH